MMHTDVSKRFCYHKFLCLLLDDQMQTEGIYAELNDSHYPSTPISFKAAQLTGLCTWTLKTFFCLLIYQVLVIKDER